MLVSPSRVLADGINSISGLLTKIKGSNGIVDIMQMLFFHENFGKPWSEELSLLNLLTRFTILCVLLANAILCVHVCGFPLS